MFGNRLKETVATFITGEAGGVAEEAESSFRIGCRQVFRNPPGTVVSNEINAIGEITLKTVRGQSQLPETHIVQLGIRLTDHLQRTESPQILKQVGNCITFRRQFGRHELDVEDPPNREDFGLGESVDR